MFIVIAYATICWFVQGKKTYKGPSEVLDGEDVVELEAVVSGSDYVMAGSSTESKRFKS